jgi:tetratricopeptide (TPR) repeat protein
MNLRRVTNILLVGLLSACSSRAFADEIILISGSSVKAPGGRFRGTIQTESPSEIEIQVGGSNQSVPIDQIASVKYDGQPASLGLAESRESNGSLTEAVELYNKSATEASDKPFVVEKAQIGRARVLAELGMTDPKMLGDAIRTLSNFISSHPKSRHALSAHELLAELQLYKADFTGASKTASDLAKLPSAGSRGTILQARIDVKQKKYNEALAAADTVVSSSGKNSASKRDALLVKAEALAGLGKYPEAEAAAREVMKGAGAEDAQVQAAAYNTMGDCLIAAGKKNEALYAYLHTDLVFFKNKDEHAKALARLVKLFRELKRDDRAQECLERLKQDYPQSAWLASLENDGEK